MKKSITLVLSVILLRTIIWGTNFILPADNSPIHNYGEYYTVTDEKVPEPGSSTVDSTHGYNDVISEVNIEAETESAAEMKVHFMDVGQGDAIFIEAPSKKILIDGGNRDSTVVDYLKDHDVDMLDLVICTHPHADHIGGLISVFESIPVKEVIDPGVVHTTKTFEDYLTLIDEKDIKYTVGRAGMSQDFGDGAVMFIVHPLLVNNLNLNDASIVVRMTFGQVVFLFSGDVERYGEDQILTKGYDLKSTILKVGHHGSNSGTTSSFLEAVSPEVAMIMVGKGNRYGHPHDETLMRLANTKIDIYRTDIHGNTVIKTNGQTYEINQKQPYQYNPPKIPEQLERQSCRNKININTALCRRIAGNYPYRAGTCKGDNPASAV